ncbi:hypothetical protein PILCRDRAFT_92180, partial [Piloderma croceum F 1598]
TVEKYNKANTAQQWTSKYVRCGEGDYGVYTFQSVAHEYYLSTASDIDDNKVQGSRGESGWWICTTTTAEWHAISVEGDDHAGSTIFVRKVKPNPTSDWGKIENWGTDAAHWDFVPVDK